MNKELNQRIAYPVHGTNAAMLYKFRARIETRTKKPLFRNEITEYRYVIEQYHMSWNDYNKGRWNTDKEIVLKKANEELDAFEVEPQGQYI